ncbi:ribosomal RNA large subunit methyltransferase J [Fonticula alba]|uniref:rRNA methyltransferase 2, mitochondrial n=1 Tax=Fonticula alba TaxID=691883 RepID=A0A058ZHB1_FONAL|nr:ribosomal RNA large subunit methyltransferase J [Fonticula alba]KCV73351.1 ribosomal RNA large subunit methyltransferase J [Fonticula alba]|eukprot:XP_009493052.1 ribosomal RNA large subunit methyltransferase J [Fonticula alba]
MLAPSIGRTPLLAGQPAWRPLVLRAFAAGSTGCTSSVAGSPPPGVGRQYSKKTHSSHQWLQRQSTDVHSRMASESGYRARSAFKLKEIQNKFDIFGLRRVRPAWTPGTRVEDAPSAEGPDAEGAAPAATTADLLAAAAMTDTDGGMAARAALLAAELPPSGANLARQRKAQARAERAASARRSADERARLAREQDRAAAAAAAAATTTTRPEMAGLPIRRRVRRVLDLGAAPGSWSQVALEILAGKVRGASSPMFHPAQAAAEKADAREVRRLAAAVAAGSSDGLWPAPPAPVTGTGLVRSITLDLTDNQPGPEGAPPAGPALSVLPGSEESPVRVIGIDLLHVPPMTDAAFVRASIDDIELCHTLVQRLFSRTRPGAPATEQQLHDPNAGDEQIHAEIVLDSGDPKYATPSQDFDPARPVDLLLSDMAPNTSGHKSSDHLRQVSLCHRALDLAEGVLSPGANAVLKVFAGSEEQELVDRMGLLFMEVHRVKPDSSRSESVEFFLVGKCFKAGLVDE